MSDTQSNKTIEQILQKLNTDAFAARESCRLRNNWEDYNGKYDRFEAEAIAALTAREERIRDEGKAAVWRVIKTSIVNTSGDTQRILIAHLPDVEYQLERLTSHGKDGKTQ